MRKNILKNLNYWKIVTEALLFISALILSWHFHWEIDSLAFFLIFLALILHPVPSRFPAGGAMVFLVTTAILVAFKKNDLAETIAIWAYYAMIFTLFMSLYELNKDKAEKI